MYFLRYPITVMAGCLFLCYLFYTYPIGFVLVSSMAYISYRICLQSFRCMCYPICQQSVTSAIYIQALANGLLTYVLLITAISVTPGLLFWLLYTKHVIVFVTDLLLLNKHICYFTFIECYSIGNLSVTSNKCICYHISYLFVTIINSKSFK